MIRIAGLLVVFLVIVPAVTFASKCERDGYTVAYVNGIFTDEQKAKDDVQLLEKEFKDRNNLSQVKFINGFNPSHFGGAGDIAQVVAQAIERPISNFDRDTILMQIHPQVTTRKILLVGHSQGTFYANEIYRYFLEHGAPEKSIAIYNVATPASYVEGGGKYLTSENDNLIKYVREWAAGANAKQPLPANISIPISSSDTADLWRGHSLSKEYLAGAPSRIISDISRGLETLVATQGSAKEGCFEPPHLGITHRLQNGIFAVADPTASGVKSVVAATGKAVAAAAAKAQAAARSLAQALANIFRKPRVQAGSQGAAATSALAPTPAHSPRAPSPAPVSNSQSVSLPPAPQIVANTEVSPAPPPPALPIPAPPAPATPPPPPIPFQSLVPVDPGFGGGGGGGSSSIAASAASTPVFVPLGVTAPADNLLSAVSPVTFSGTTTSGFAVALAYGAITATTTADGSGNWSLALSLPEGTTAVAAVAADGSGNTSDGITRTVTVDTTPPASPSPSIAECSAVPAGSYCEIATTTVNVSWSSIADAAHYGYAQNTAKFSTTTATSIKFVGIDSNATTTFSIAAYDALGNAATSSVSVFVIPPPPAPPGFSL